MSSLLIPGLMCVLFSLSIPGASRAANCPDSANSAGYVRAGATGSGSGADWANAYTSLPSNLVRGCTYYVAVGNYPSHTFGDADSTTTLITVQTATIASHGTAAGWSNAYQGQVVFTAPINFDTDYYVFNGAYRSTATGIPNTDWVLESGYGFKVNNQVAQAGASIVGGSGYKGSTCGSLSACSSLGIFVHDITIEYVDVNGAHTKTDAGDIDDGMDFEGGSYNIDWSHDYVHDAAVPFYLRGNHNGQAGGGYFFGTGNNDTIEYTYIQNDYSSPTYHSEGCSCSEGLTNFTYRYNFSDQIGGVGGNGATAHIGTASGADYNNGNGNNGPWNIYGNVFTCSSTNANQNCAVGDGVLAIWDARFTGAVYFLNNTVYDIGPNSLEGYDGLGLAYTTPMTTVIFENNLVFDNDPMTVIHSGATNQDGATFTSFTWDYTSYFQTPTAGAADSDSHKQVSSSNPFTNSTCCMLASDTAAGTSTDSILPSNDTDMLGVLRGANGTWDRGALQVGGASSQLPQPAQNLQVIKVE